MNKFSRVYSPRHWPPVQCWPQILQPRSPVFSGHSGTRDTWQPITDEDFLCPPIRDEYLPGADVDWPNLGQQLRLEAWSEHSSLLSHTSHCRTEQPIRGENYFVLTNQNWELTWSWSSHTSSPPPSDPAPVTPAASLCSAPNNPAPCPAATNQRSVFNHKPIRSE